MGGPSAEREVSLRSGTAVAGALRQRGYAVTEVDVPGPGFTLPAGSDAAFIALHGTFGEDGDLQAELDARDIPYTGSGAVASRTAFDKVATKDCALACGVPTADYRLVRPGDAPPLPLPVVVKPARQGSSIGVHRVFAPADWDAAVNDAFTFDDKVLAETFVPGRELTVGVLDEDVLPAVEIVTPEGGWYDYQSKYTRGVCEYRVPASLPEALSERLRKEARKIYAALGCRGMARVDFRLTAAGEPFLLEVNTIPGFTETSLLPKAAAVAGFPFPVLCERILSRARCG